MVVAIYQKYLSDSVAPRPDERALAERATRLQGERAEGSDKGGHAKPQQNASETSAAVGSGGARVPGKGAAQGGGAEVKGKGNGQGGDDDLSKSMAPAASTKKDKDSFNGFVAYNGGDCGPYRWSQTIDEVSM